MFFKDILKQIKSKNLGEDVMFLPDIHPDGLVLNYSTNYEFRDEREDILMNSTSNCIELPMKIRTYLTKEYGTVDINDTNYGRHFKKWPLETQEVLTGLPKQERELLNKELQDGVKEVIDFLVNEKNMSIKTFLYPNMDVDDGLYFDKYLVEIEGV